MADLNPRRVMVESDKPSAPTTIPQTPRATVTGLSINLPVSSDAALIVVSGTALVRRSVAGYGLANVNINCLSPAANNDQSEYFYVSDDVAEITLSPFWTFETTDGPGTYEVTMESSKQTNAGTVYVEDMGTRLSAIVFDR